MFSAIANFLFGGEKSGSEDGDLSDQERTTTPTGKKERVAFCRKQAGDWLLVDLSDDDADVDMDDKENRDIDEDSILSALPFLMPMDTSFEVSSSEQPLDVAYCQDQFLLTPSSCLVSEIAEERYAEALPIEGFATTPILGRVCRSSILAHFYENFVNVETKLARGAVAVKPVTTPRTDKKVLPIDVKRITRKKYFMPCSAKSKQEKTDKRSNHPAELTGAFLNPQSPILVSKTEFLQQIKDLKPAQHAKERDVKKWYTKAQMNRQNKAYLYESSNKNTHRRDLWLRHSGANNNRKCC